MDLEKTTEERTEEAPELVLYSKPSCPQCDATKRHFNKLKLDYRVVDISEDETARDYVMDLGHLRAPVVVYGNQHWSGYRPTDIDRLFKKA